jgi:hypothetical protein
LCDPQGDPVDEEVAGEAEVGEHGAGGKEEALASAIMMGLERRLKLRLREQRAKYARNAARTTPEKLAARLSRWMRDGRGRVVESAPERGAPRRPMATTAAKERWHVTLR